MVVCMDHVGATKWAIKYCEELIRHGIKNTDMVYFSSDISRILINACSRFGVKSKKDINQFLGILINQFKIFFGREGTILVPVFSWEFCRSNYFDINKTLGEVGLLGNWILENDSDFIRTSHPIYSFMVYGVEAPKILSIDSHDGWGKDSVFDYLYNKHAKNILIDVSLEESFTFSHHVEKMIGVPFRYNKDFEGIYIDIHGKTSKKIYSMYVRDLDIISRQSTDNRYLQDKGVARIYTFEDGLDVQIVDLFLSYEIIEKNLKYDMASAWYCFHEYTYKYGDTPTHKYEIKSMNK